MISKVFYAYLFCSFLSCTLFRGSFSRVRVKSIVKTRLCLWYVYMNTRACVCVKKFDFFVWFRFFFFFFLLLNNDLRFIEISHSNCGLFSYIKSTSWSATLPSRTSWAVKNNTNCLVNYHYYYQYIYEKGFTYCPFEEITFAQREKYSSKYI